LTKLARLVCLSSENEGERRRRGGDTLALPSRSLRLGRDLDGVRERWRLGLGEELESLLRFGGGERLRE
jgi:hypothetical protein